MKQLIQSYRTGELGLYDVPPPVCGENGVLVRTAASLVSAGTEKMIVDIAKKSLIGKAKARPDLVRQIISKMKQEGIRNTVAKVFTKLDTPIPLGYSCAGRVVEIGERAGNVNIGDRVACGGAGYASHSEVNYIPRNLFVKIPDNVDDLSASFVTVGAIALQGVRQAEPALGENVAVIGLGLIGQLTVQLLKANGCRVLGTDIDREKLSLAASLGADMVCSPDDLVSAARDFSSGNGVDKVIITASTSSNRPITDAGEVARLRGRVVVVGMVGMDVPRNSYYKKELDIRLSMAYGPGRYDPDYEEKGIDYPYPHVRWTEQRNFEAFLNLVGEGKVTPGKLVTHKFAFPEALKAYDILDSKTKERYLGIVLEYGDAHEERGSNLIRIAEGRSRSESLSVGLIGAGNFTKSVILPAITGVGGFELTGLCTATGVSAHATGRKYGFKYITTDAAAIIENPEVNTVVVTTRHDTHAGYVIKALKEGKHVFTEKPLCISEQDLSDIRDAYLSLSASRAPLLMVGFNRRFAPLVRRMREAVKQRPVSIVYRVNAGIIPRESWIQDSVSGGGRILGEVCHFVDTCAYLAGSRIESVFSSCVRKSDRSIPDEDNVSSILRFANGSTAVINFTAFGNKQMPKERIEVFASDTAMEMNDYRELTIYSGSRKEKLGSSNQDKGFNDEFRAFRDSVKSGAPAVPFETVYNTTLATFKLLESLRVNAPVSV